VAPSSIQKYLSIMSLETSSHPFFIGLTSVSGSGPVNLLAADLSFFPLVFSLLFKKLQLDPLGCWYFNFNSYFFHFLIFVLKLL
jgi:hypothetical protein